MDGRCERSRSESVSGRGQSLDPGRDVISGFSGKIIKGLNEASRRRRFLVFRDRKFSETEGTFAQSNRFWCDLLIPGTSSRHSTI